MNAMKPLRIAAVLFALVPLYASAGFSLEARSDYERWDTGFGDTTNRGAWVGLGAQYAYERFFGGVGIGSSVGMTRIEKFPDTSIARRELDVFAGYQLTPKWSIFSGYRLYSIEYDGGRDISRSFTDDIQGFGGGLGFGTGLSPRVASFISAQMSGVLGAIHYKGETPVDRGWGLSFGGETGLAFRLTPALNLVTSLKYQTMNIEYGDFNWTNSYARAGARLNYRF